EGEAEHGRAVYTMRGPGPFPTCGCRRLILRPPWPQSADSAIARDRPIFERGMQRTLLFSDARCLAHETPYDHPESPRRLGAILDSLHAAPVDGAAWASFRPATREELLLVHRPEYVDAILALRGRTFRLDPDTWLSSGSVDAALLAAGASIEAVRALCEGKATTAFALVRPPGHHAEPDRAMGFCVFNNAAIAAAAARAQFGCERILLVDWDVHHGNGSQRAFWTRPDVLYFRSEEHTSELQSRENLVCRLRLEKKKKRNS